MLSINTELNLEHALEFIIFVAKTAGDILNEYYCSEIKYRKKEGRDIVTNVDIMVEEEITNLLKMHYPNYSIFSEETNNDTLLENEWKWVIDPLDGTINYFSKLPFFSTSIALQKNNETVIGVVFDPIANEMYSAIKGYGSFSNGRKISVSREETISNSVLSFMLTSHYNEEQIDNILKKVRSLLLETRGLRLYVSQALELAYIASGRLEGTVCIKSRGFSSAAGTLIVREAGGEVTDINGIELNNDSKSIVATNSFIHKQLLKALKNK